MKIPNSGANLVSAFYLEIWDVPRRISMAIRRRGTFTCKCRVIHMQVPRDIDDYSYDKEADVDTQKTIQSTSSRRPLTTSEKRWRV